MDYSKTVRLNLPYDEAVPQVKAAFQRQGFGTLTEIDVTATLAEKLGVQMERYFIIGACNPNLAQQALAAEPEIGLLLPCNVVVREDGRGVVVHALDASVIASVPENAELAPIAEEAGRLIAAALDELQAAAG